MYESQSFQQLVEADNLTGEVVGSNGFIVEVKGLEGVQLGAQVLFEDGQRGLVREAHGDRVLLFNLDSEAINLGTLVVVQSDQLQVPVGEGLIGRVVSPLGQPLDEQGAVNYAGTSGLFNPAPGIMDREPLKDQLPTGVAFVDMFFPVVLGQRIAILGDTKAGKTTFLTQMTISQANSGRIVVYVMIGKRRVDIENLVAKLNETGAIKHTIVVVANIFDSLTQTYLAPYAGCAIAEHLWRRGRDVVVVYDDLSAHAEAYRQLSLLQEVDPGRDSYPGDMFYAHSSLLERAGKLLDGGHTLTSLPVVVTPNNDITAYLSTSIMSITDGQIIFDLELFRQGIRPAVNSGLSVSRVGGNAQTKRQKLLTGSLVKKLAQFHQAEEFSHFGSSLSQEASLDLALGKVIFQALNQGPSDMYPIPVQQLVLETIMKTEGKRRVDVPALKQAAMEVADQISDDAALDRLGSDLYQHYTQLPPQPAAEKPAPAPEPETGKKKGKQAGKEKQHAPR